MVLPPPSRNHFSSREALFRYQVLSKVLSRVMGGENSSSAVEVVAAERHADFDGSARRVSARTIYRWLEAFGPERDIAKLEPAQRSRTRSSTVLPASLLDFMAIQKRDDFAASIPELLRRARGEGVLSEASRIDRTTVYRACRRMGVPVRRSKRAAVRDSRRFAYPHRMQLCLSDGKHFRAGVTRARRVAMFFLDDCSRFGLDVVVGPTECKELFLRGLFLAVSQYGRMGIMYLDHGSGFIAEETVTVCQQLPALLIHGEKAYPEGHGKIERFHRTLKAACLRHLDGRPDVNPDCGALELRLRHWLREVYNHTPHESLGSQTPWTKFSSDEKRLDLPESLEKLRECFVLKLERKATNDHIVPVGGTHFEVPRGLAGSRVTLYQNVLSGKVSCLHLGRLMELHPVDLALNATTRRGASPVQPASPGSTNDDPAPHLPKSAADLAFERDFRPVLGADGGCPDTDPPKPDQE